MPTHASIKNSFLLCVMLIIVTVANAQFIQQGPKLVGTGSTGPAAQGISVAISANGNTAIVGAYTDNAAWIYIRTGGVWTQQGPKLVGTGGVGNSHQGMSVAISDDGNTVVVGGYLDNQGIGAAWVFSRSGDNWTQMGKKLVGSGATNTAYHGWAVAISGDGNTIMVGGYADNSIQGAAWVYTRSFCTWIQQGAKLIGLGSTIHPTQGSAVALSANGNTAVIGGSQDDDLVGAIWIFTRSGNTWTQQGSKLVGNDISQLPSPRARIGAAVAISSDGNTVITGGYGDNNSVGAAWIFTRSGNTWSQQGPKLIANDYEGSPQLGIRVGISGDGNTVVIGGYNDANATVGAAWIFTRSGNAWSQQGGKLIGTGVEGTHGSSQGVVAISKDGSTVIDGGYKDNDQVGAAWIFYSGNGSSISSFLPTSAAKGSTVTITGNNFAAVTAVSFGGVAASSFTVVNSTTITAVVGSGASGDVSVTTGSGTITQPGFTYITTPTATIRGNANVCAGSPSPLVTFTGANGIPPYTFTYSINNIPQAPLTTVSGNSATVAVTTSISPKTYTYKLVQVADNSGSIRPQTGTITVKVGPYLPLTPVIIGPSSVCNYIGTFSYAAYSIDEVANATGYDWTMPPGAKIVKDGTTTITPTDFLHTTSLNIEVAFGNDFLLPGDIQVMALSACGNSAAAKLHCTRNIPATPGAISGITDPCQLIGTGLTTCYSVAPVKYAQFYQWSYTINGFLINAGQSMPTIEGLYPGPFGAGDLMVQALNGCGVSAVRRLPISIKLPPRPGLITTTGDICSSIYSGTSKVTYTVAPNTISPLPTSYIWTLTPTVSGTASITGGDGQMGIPTSTSIETSGLSIDVKFINGFTLGKLSVKGRRVCGDGIERALTLKKNLEPTPVVQASDVPCLGQASTIIYTIQPPILNTDQFIWTSPPGTNITEAGLTNHNTYTGSGTSIHVEYKAGFSSGQVTVKAKSVCGTTPAAVLPVTAITCFAVNHRLQTAVEDISVSTASVYPNPNKGEFKIVIDAGNQRANAIIQIVNSYGELLREMKGINNNGIITINVSENNLPAGLYQVRYRIDKEWKSMKVIIQK